MLLFIFEMSYRHMSVMSSTFSLACCIQLHITEQFLISEAGCSWERTRRHAASAARGSALGVAEEKGGRSLLRSKQPLRVAFTGASDLRISPGAPHWPFSMPLRASLPAHSPTDLQVARCEHKSAEWSRTDPRAARANCRDCSIRADKENAEPP